MEENPLPISLFTFYSLKARFVPFLKGWPATIPCKRKTIKWATKLLIKKEGKGKKSKSRFWLVRMHEKQKKLFNYVKLVEKNMPF